MSEPEQTVEQEAPFGRFPDGRIRKRRPNRKTGEISPPAKTGARRSRKIDYREPLQQVLGVAMVTVSAVNQADGAAIMLHGPQIVESLAGVAEANPTFAAALERFMTVTPYSALVVAVLPLLAQIGTNHGVVPSQIGGALGAVDPATLIKQVTQSDR